VPIVRTFAPPVAGAADMRYAKYVSFSAAGSLLWVWSMVLTGYWLGSSVPNIDQNIHYVIAVVVILSIMPAVVEAIRLRRVRS